MDTVFPGTTADNILTFFDWRADGFLDFIRIERRIARGKKIGVANGVFDLFHLGHLNFLRQAEAETGCVLFVLVNTDESAARLKGPRRPYVPLPARMELLSALPCVRAVAGFAEDTPAAALAAIRPDILFKGEEYLGTVIPGAECCGRVVYLPETPGFRTTTLEAKIAAGNGGPASTAT